MTERRQLKYDTFATTMEISQQIDENVSIEQVANELKVFVAECPHKATKNLFSGSVVTDHHHKTRNLDIALGVYRAVMAKKYQTIEDLEESLTSINEAMRAAMKKDNLSADIAFYTLLVGSVASIGLGYFVYWALGVGVVALTAAVFAGVRSYAKSNNAKLINVLDGQAAESLV